MQKQITLSGSEVDEYHQLLQLKKRRGWEANASHNTHAKTRTDAEIVKSLHIKGIVEADLLSLLRKIHSFDEVEPWIRKLLSTPKVRNFSSLPLYICFSFSLRTRTP